MSVYDRDYMRPEHGGPRGVPTSWTVRIIITNVVLFLGTMLLGGVVDVGGLLALSLDNLAAGKVWTLLTAGFVHAGPMHLLWNMLALWFFGAPVESELGSRRYLRFYVLTVVLAFVPFLISEGVQGHAAASTVGASGAVMAVLIFMAFRAPSMRVIVFIFPMKLWVLAAIAVAIDFLGLGGRDGINHWAHLSGAALGYLEFRYSFPSRLVDRLPEGLLASRRRARGAPPAPRRQPGQPRPAQPLQAHRSDADRERVDQLLQKISEHGITSLTDEEREFLKRASKGYR